MSTTRAINPATARAAATAAGGQGRRQRPGPVGFAL